MEGRRDEVGAICAAFHLLEEGVLIFDQDGAVLAANPAAAQILGVPLDEMLGATPREADAISARYQHGAAVTGENSAALRVLRTGRAERGLVIEFRDPGSGEVRFIRANLHPLVEDSEGPPWGVVGSFVDMTERERALSELAFRDPLTGLPNRRVLEQHLEVAIARSQRSGQSLGILFFDVDNLKGVNDTLGHGAGDALLKGIAERLSRITRPTDVLARRGSGEHVIGRLGGDEFLLLLADLQNDAEHTLALIAERVQEHMSDPFTVVGQPCAATVSWGMAAYPGDGDSATELLAHADRAMYAAKRAGQQPEA
jgi:diguanylate cyclase (GGDEF)-like protein/PAS domain S-box-containing protein